MDPGVKLKDISEQVGRSEQSAKEYTLSLEKKGLLTVIKRLPLTFELSNRALDLFGLKSVKGSLLAQS